VGLKGEERGGIIHG